MIKLYVFKGQLWPKIRNWITIESSSEYRVVLNKNWIIKQLHQRKKALAKRHDSTVRPVNQVFSDIWPMDTKPCLAVCIFFWKHLEPMHFPLVTHIYEWVFTKSFLSDHCFSFLMQFSCFLKKKRKKWSHIFESVSFYFEAKLSGEFLWLMDTGLLQDKSSMTNTKLQVLFLFCLQ